MSARPPPPRAKVVLLAGLLAVSLPRLARAEDVVSVKHQSWQEEGGRIRVDATSALIEKELSVATKLRLTGVVDVIAGATPNGQPAPAGRDQVPLSYLDDRREAWTIDLSHQFSRSLVTIGHAQSRESDYLSDGWSVNTATDFNEKHTTLLAGFAWVDDDITALPLRAPRTKDGWDAMVGVTQILGPRASLTVNLTHGRTTGYLSDPYKIIKKDTEIVPGFSLPRTFPENRPEEREKWILHGALNLSLPEAGGVLEASVRAYRDDWEVTSATFAVEWFHQLAERLIVRPAVRYYRQSEADFYRITLDGSPIVPGNIASGRAPYYSADYRLAELDSFNVGIKVVWTLLEDRLTLDGAYERYTMRGRDGRTSKSAFPKADVYTVGARWAW
jgi:hypothetical protein